MRIRDIQLADHARVLAMNSASIPAVSELTLAQLQALVAQTVYARVVECEGVVAGFLLGFVAGADYASPNYQWFCAHYDAFFYVDRIVIGEGWRGQGLGAALYADVDAWARTHDLSPVTCEVNLRPRNAASLAFHASCGFEQVGTQDTEGGSKTVAMLAKTRV